MERPAIPDLQEEGRGSGLFSLAGVLGTCATHRTSAVLAPQHGVVAGACSAEFPVRLDKDFDGDARHAQAEEANGQKDFRDAHGAKVRGRQGLSQCVGLGMHVL